MAANTVATRASTGVDELLFQNDSVSLCLLVNRRHATVRVIDFRAGPTVAKRNFVLAAAKRERCEKIFTLVERDEVATWTRLGFTREGSIPAFYKRSDAWILGAVVADMRPLTVDPTLGADDDDDDLTPAGPSTSVTTAERTIARAKRLAKAPEKTLPKVALAKATAAEVKRALVAADKRGTLLTGFEPFGRDVAPRPAFALTARGGFTLLASWEAQPAFSNALFELHAAPETEAERVATIASVRVVEARLAAEGMTSLFTLAPSDDVTMTSVFVACGYRRSAVLASHLAVGGARKDAIVWSKKFDQEN
jgi:hypothetical protein